VDIQDNEWFGEVAVLSDSSHLPDRLPNVLFGGVFSTFSSAGKTGLGHSHFDLLAAPFLPETGEQGEFFDEFTLHEFSCRQTTIIGLAAQVENVVVSLYAVTNLRIVL